MLSPILAPDFSRKVLKNPYGSDHFRIMLERKVPLPGILMRMPRWKYNKADWTLSETRASLNPNTFATLSPEESKGYFTEAIMEATTISIPLTPSRLPKCWRPW